MLFPVFIIIMDKLTIGQKVLIKHFKYRPGHWNSSGEMDYLMGHTVTIESKGWGGKRIHVTENVWIWQKDDFELEKEWDL